MIDNVPADKPILVFCSYRTGSTALCNQLANQLDYRNFDEAYHPTLFRKRQTEFLSYKQNSNSYVWKLMPDQITADNHSDIVDTWQKSFVIKLTRRDTVAQIASWYISHLTDNWHQVKNHAAQNQNVWHKNQSDLSELVVPVDGELLNRSISSLLAINNLVDKLPPESYNLHLEYEDISLQHSEYVPRAKPKNYRELTETIHTKVNQMQ